MTKNINTDCTLLHTLDTLPWHEAVTYRETYPHEYIVRGEVNPDVFYRLFDLIREAGVFERWNNQPVQYFYYGPFKYWVMTEHKSLATIINRVRI